MPFVPARCTQCGAALEVNDARDAAICPHCGTPFIAEKAVGDRCAVDLPRDAAAMRRLGREFAAGMQERETAREAAEAARRAAEAAAAERDCARSCVRGCGWLVALTCLYMLMTSIHEPGQGPMVTALCLSGLCLTLYGRKSALASPLPVATLIVGGAVTGAFGICHFSDDGQGFALALSTAMVALGTSRWWLPPARRLDARLRRALHLPPADADADDGAAPPRD